jgi:membrane protein required for colicin V production
MNPLDIALVALLALPAVLGLWKGLANIVTALVGLWAAFLVAPVVKRLLEPGAQRLVPSPELAAVLAYAAGFVATLLLVGLLGWLVTRSLKTLDLQWANRLAGAALGVLCGLLLGGVLVAALQSAWPESGALRASALAGPLGRATRFLVALAPEREGSAPAPGTAPPAPSREPLPAKPATD